MPAESHLVRYSLPLWSCTPDQIFKCFQRNLHIRGIVDDQEAFEYVFDRLQQLAGTRKHTEEYEDWSMADLSARLKYRPNAPDPKRTGTYEPEVGSLAQAERLFAAARSLPLREENSEMDDVLIDEWSKFTEMGKVGLFVLCHNFEAASEIQDKENWWDAVDLFLDRIDDAVSLFIDIEEYEEVAPMLRVDPGEMQAWSGLPASLLQTFSQLLDSINFRKSLPDPLNWWLKHEASIPDIVPADYDDPDTCEPL